MGILASSTNSPWSAGQQLLSPQPAPGTSAEQNQQGTETSISPRTITEDTREKGRLTRQIHRRLAKDNKILPSFLTFPTGGNKKEKKSKLCRFSKPSAKQGLQPHRPRKRYHSRNHECTLYLRKEKAYMPQLP